MATVTITGRIKQSGPKGNASAYAAALADPNTWAGAVGEVLVEDVEQRFQTQSDPWGQAWEALKPSTLRSRAARGLSGPILQITRTLANSKYSRLVGRAVVVGLAVGYAVHHQYGAPSAGLPARPILPMRGGKPDLPTRLRDEIKATVQDAIKLAVERFAG